MADGAIRSTAAGGEWAQVHLAAAYHPLIAAALAAYRAGPLMPACGALVMDDLTREVAAALPRARQAVSAPAHLPGQALLAAARHQVKQPQRLPC